MSINEREFIKLALKEGLTEEFITDRLQRERNKFVPTDALIKGDTLSLKIPESQSVTVDALPVVEDLTPELSNDFKFFSGLSSIHPSSSEKKEKIAADVISGLKDFERTTENIALVFPAIEAITEVTTATLASGLAGIAGLANLHSVETIFDPIRKLQESQALMTEIQKLLTFEAPSERGKELSEAAQFPFEKLNEFGAKGGEIIIDELTDTALDAYKEVLATAFETAVVGSPFLISALGKVKPKVTPEPLKVNVKDFPKPERTPKKVVTLKPKKVKITKDLKVKPKSRQKPVIVPEQGKIGNAGFETVKKEQVGRLKELKRQDEILLKTQKELKEKRKTAMKFKDEAKAKEITKDLADIAKNRKQIATDIAKTKRVSTKQKIEVKPEPKKEVKVDRKLEEAKRKEKAKVEKDARRKHNKAVTSVEKQFDKPFSDMDFSELDNINPKQSRQVDNSKVTVARLHEIAKEAGIKGQSKMKKQQLIDSIVEESKKPEAIDSPVENNVQLTSKEPPKNVHEFDTPTPKNKIAAEVEKMFDEADLAKKESKKPTFEGTKRFFSRTITDVSGNLKRRLLKEFGVEGKWAQIKHDQILGSSARSKHISEMLEKDVYGGLNGNTHKTLDRYLVATRIIDIDKKSAWVVKKITKNQEKIVARFPDKQSAVDFANGKERHVIERHKHPKGIPGTDHQIWIDQLNPELRVLLEERAKIYHKAMLDNLKEMHKEGLIGDQTFDVLKHDNYTKRSYLEKLDPEDATGFSSLRGKKITVTQSGIESLKSGSEGFLESNTKLLADQVIATSQARIAKNQANKAMLKLSEVYPDNGIVKEFKGGKVPNGWTKIDVFEKGRQRAMIMPDEFARQWVTSDPILNNQVSNWISWMSGAKVLRAGATQFNPAFAFTNFPRDAGHIYLTTNEYSSFIPKAAAQFTKDALSVTKDAWRKTGQRNDFIMEGGGMDFLSQQGEFKGKFEKIGKYRSHFGEFSEMTSRLALRKRAIKNLTAEAIKRGEKPNMKAIQVEATNIARNYLDFNKGGQVVKAIDSAFPYFNAGTQATRGIVRAARDTPVKFTWKVANIGALSTGLYFANKFLNTEAYDAIPERDKMNNWIITTPLSWVDGQGNRRYRYIKIAKDQGQRGFATFFEALMKRSFEGEFPTDMVMESFKDLVSIMPLDNLPPNISAYFGYMNNRDFWRNEDIWKGAEVEDPTKEWTPNTHPFFFKSGQLLGMSPARLEAAMGAMFTSNNPYASMVGMGFTELFGDLPIERREKVLNEHLDRIPGMSRIFTSTYPRNTRDDEIEEATRKEAGVRLDHNRSLNSKMNELFNDKISEKQLISWIDSHKSGKEIERLHRRYQELKIMEDIPNRGFWNDLRRSSPEIRAHEYFVLWEDASPEKRKELDIIIDKIPGFTSESFVSTLDTITKNYNEWLKNGQPKK
ncbi:hypothetical protein HN682_01030 [Candidatus Peregrinibacteria bacterium]|nr:hypothetical protein [Candidatus Peregrinibacteria bacterium]